MATRAEKLSVGLLAILLFIVLVAPPAMYFYTMRLVDGTPEKASPITKLETDHMWQEKELCTYEECSNTTPYWIYRLLIIALVSDLIIKIDSDMVQKKVSIMASRIALSHMREGNFKGEGMLWWHLTGAFSGIWLQRNWSKAEIAAKYAEIDA